MVLLNYERAVDIYLVNMFAFFPSFFSLEKEFDSARVGPALTMTSYQIQRHVKSFIYCSGTIIFTRNANVLLDQLHS